MASPINDKEPLGAPVVIVHSLEAALTALKAAAALKRRIFLASAEGAAAQAGALWFRGLLEAAAAETGGALAGGIIDCGPYPGPVMECLELGLTRIRFTGPPAIAKKLAAMAEARGAQVITGELNAFDSLDKEAFEADLEAWLQAAF